MILYWSVINRQSTIITVTVKCHKNIWSKKVQLMYCTRYLSGSPGPQKGQLPMTNNHGLWPHLGVYTGHCKKINSQEYFIFLYVYLHYFFSVVVETLKTVDKDRKCFRMVGGILSERTVKDVLPALLNNVTQVCYSLIFIVLHFSACVHCFMNRIFTTLFDWFSWASKNWVSGQSFFWKSKKIILRHFFRIKLKKDLYKDVWKNECFKPSIAIF